MAPPSFLLPRAPAVALLRTPPALFIGGPGPPPPVAPPPPPPPPGETVAPVRPPLLRPPRRPAHDLLERAALVALPGDHPDGQDGAVAVADEVDLAGEAAPRAAQAVVSRLGEMRGRWAAQLGRRLGIFFEAGKADWSSCSSS